VIFTPTNNFLAPPSSVIGITDGFGGTNSALIFVTVTNRGPSRSMISAPKNVAGDNPGLG